MPRKDVQAENKPLEQAFEKCGLRTQQETRMQHQGDI